MFFNKTGYHRLVLGIFLFPYNIDSCEVDNIVEIVDVANDLEEFDSVIDVSRSIDYVKLKFQNVLDLKLEFFFDTEDFPLV